MSDPTERDLVGGARFVHICELQGRSELRSLAVQVRALVHTLIDKAIIDPVELADFRARSEAEAERNSEAMVLPRAERAVTPEPPPVLDIPCAENVAVCKAACCRLKFALTLDEVRGGTIAWAFGAPYLIRLDESGRCVHNDRARQCNIYEQRPGRCRQYDCRNDARIWRDYEQRIPSEAVAALP